MALKELWNAITGKAKARNPVSDQEFYERLSDFEAVVKNNTKLLRDDHDRLDAKLDEQTKRINQIFDDMSQVDDDSR